MRALLLLLALAMPGVAWVTNSGLLGPNNAEISARYPTLIVAAGYAFAIWGPIFLLDIVFAIRQVFVGSADARLRRVRVLTAFGFALTSVWMLVFTRQWFWSALVVIWASLACMLAAAWLASETARQARGPWWQWLPLSLHAGWVSLAAFLNVAQVVVAFALFSTDHMLAWTLVLFALAGGLLAFVLIKLRGNPWYALAAVWGLVGVYVGQRHSSLPGAETAASVALALAVLLAVLAMAAYRHGSRQSPR